MQFTSDLALWTAAIAFLMPLIQAAVVQFHWRHDVQAVLSFLACAVAAAGNAYFNGDLSGRSFVTMTLVIFVGAIGSYQGFWKPTGIAGAIEDATSPKRAGV